MTSRPWSRLLLVAGPKRSGTTWVGHVLSQAEGVGYIFEPEKISLHQRSPHSRRVKELNDLPRWFIGGAGDDPDLREMIDAYREHVSWILRQSPAGPAADVVIKTPESERLGLFIQALEPERVLYIRRHPLGIVNSYEQSNLYGAWKVERDFERMSAEVPSLGCDYNFTRASTPLEKVALMTHIRYRLAESSLAAQPRMTIEYEDLCRDAPGEFRRIFAWLGWAWNERLKQAVLDTAFPETEDKGFFDVHKNSRQRADGWRTELSKGQIEAVHGLFGDLGIRDYPFPGDGLRVLSPGEITTGHVTRWRRAARRGLFGALDKVLALRRCLWP